MPELVSAGPDAARPVDSTRERRAVRRLGVAGRRAVPHVAASKAWTSRVSYDRVG